MSTSFTRLVVSAFVLVIVACIPVITRPTPDRYALHVSDNVKERRFDIVFKSNDSKALCISMDSWPNSSGQFTVGREDVILETSAGALLAKSTLHSAYCPGGCGVHRIEDKGELRGFIAYEAFGDAGELAENLSKKLKFQVFPYYCR